jgi:chemotaxis protein methyltransferase CheR
MSIAEINSASSLGIEQFRELRDIIYEKSGIFFGENKLFRIEYQLGKRILELEMNSFDEYVRYVQSQNGSSTEFHQIYNAVTVNETFFFRFEPQLEAFRNKLLPRMVERRLAAGDRRLNIWSAASSSGEELYTLAIILREFFGPATGQWQINLLGTDISHKALGQAREAVYTPNSFRNTMADGWKANYFKEEGKDFRLREEIKAMAWFHYLNLIESREYRRLQRMDFIFCRNVLIYFDMAIKKRVVHSLYDVLNHGGHLFLGEAESLHGISAALKVEHFRGAFAYVKE